MPRGYPQLTPIATSFTVRSSPMEYVHTLTDDGLDCNVWHLLARKVRWVMILADPIGGV